VGRRVKDMDNIQNLIKSRVEQTPEGYSKNRKEYIKILLY